MMKMLLGLTTPTSGSFTIDGKRFPDDRIAILKEIGAFIELPAFYSNLTGRDVCVQVHDTCAYVYGGACDAISDAWIYRFNVSA